MAAPDADPLELATRALRHHDRSRNELDERLRQAGVDEDTRLDALETLERIGYLDDSRLAEARAASLAERGYGDAAIRQDLAGRGIAATAVETAVDKLLPEVERAGATALRLGRTPRTAARLARKGFAAESIEVAVGLDSLDA